MQEKNGITPVALLTRPMLPADLVPYYNAFTLFNSLRGGNMAGEQPIRISEMVAYLSAINETSVDQRMKFIRLMAELDRTYLQYRSEQASSKA